MGRSCNEEKGLRLTLLQLTGADRPTMPYEPRNPLGFSVCVGLSVAWLFSLRRAFSLAPARSEPEERSISTSASSPGRVDENCTVNAMDHIGHLKMLALASFSKL